MTIYPFMNFDGQQIGYALVYELELNQTQKALESQSLLMPSKAFRSFKCYEEEGGGMRRKEEEGGGKSSNLGVIVITIISLFECL